jgi:hypothetical protein
LHETPVSRTPSPGGASVFWIDQLDPFQRSIRGESNPVSELLSGAWNPTAVQAVADVHDTASSVLL